MNRTDLLPTILTSDHLAALCRRGAAQAARLGHAVAVSLTSPYDTPCDPLEVFGRTSGTGARRCLWFRPEQNFWLAGHGLAVELTAGADGTLDAVKVRHRELLDNAIVEAPEAATAPVFFGGMRYDPRTPPEAAWRGFPEASFALPRFVFSRSGGRTWLSVNALVEAGNDGDALSEALLEELRRLEARRGASGTQPRVTEILEESRETWRTRVETALGAIEDGTVSKVVLSRHRELRAAGAFSPEAALDYLARAYPSCAVFAVANGDAVFLGASPEGLASVNGGRLTVTCLASSAPRGATPDEDGKYRDYLLESHKERREHAAVAGMLAENLRDVCAELQWHPEPQVLKLKNIQHLYTPFTGRLRPGVNILDIVGRLHPTPAVGGVPTAAALDLIRRLEGDRGWYAAPVGWCDGDGNGDFIVAIRSALLRGDTAHLYAGCGIVSGSEAEREYLETELKFQPLLAALAAER